MDAGRGSLLAVVLGIRSAVAATKICTDAKFMGLLNQAADVVTYDLTENLIDHSDIGKAFPRKSLR